MYENEQQRPTLTTEFASDSISTDQSLTAIKYARRLQKITTSIEQFFQNQMERLESALKSCQVDVERANEFYRTLASFAAQKQEWEAERTAEFEQLDRACAQLTEGWKLLENARRKWLIEKSNCRSQQAEQLQQQEQNPAWALVESNVPGGQVSQTDSREINALELESLRQAMLQHRNRNC